MVVRLQPAVPDTGFLPPVLRQDDTVANRFLSQSYLHPHMLILVSTDNLESSIADI